MPDQAGQRAASDALAAEAAQLGAHFEGLEARIEEAKSQAAAACQPMSGERKVLALFLTCAMHRCLFLLPRRACWRACLVSDVQILH